MSGYHGERTVNAEIECRQSGLLWLLVVAAVLALLLIFALPAQLPALENVQPRLHAIQNHGTDAIIAREALTNCGEGLRVKVCPPSNAHGLSVYMWCETTGSYLCPGCITTISGIEKTAFLRPCTQWEECR